MSFLSSFNQNIKYILNVCTHHRKRVLLSLLIFSFVGLSLFLFRSKIFQSASMSNPIAYWQFDEGNGTTVYDHVGNNDAALSGSIFPTWLDKEHCISESCLSFDGSNDQIEVGDNASLSITGDLTISGWIKPKETTASTRYPIVGKWDGAAGKYSYLLEQYGDEIRMYIDSTSNYVTTNAANLQVSSWYHIQAVYNSSAQSVQVYINSVPYGTTTTGTIPNSIGDDTDKLFIGYIQSAGVASSATYQVTANDDDGSSTAVDGVWHSYGNYDNSYANTSHIPLGGKEGDGNAITTGLRFQNVAIVQGATVSSADLDFMEAWGSSYTTNVKVKISASDEDDCSLGAGNLPSNKTKTTAQLDWDSNGSQGGPGAWYSTSATVPPPDIASVIQEVVDRPGWTSGNDICVLIADDGSSSDWWFEVASRESGANNAAKLSVSTSNAPEFKYKGVIDDLKIYNYALTDNQTKSNYAGRGTVKGSAASFGNSDVSKNLTNGLIGYWKMDENTGTSTLDSSGNSNTGALGSGSSAPTWSSGKFGSGLTFDGTADNVIVQDADILTSQQFTISSWFKWNGVTTSAAQRDFMTIVSKGQFSSGEYTILVNRSSSNLVFNLYIEGTVRTSWTSSNFDTNWHQITATYDGNKANIYIDGILKSSSTVAVTITNSTNILGIGKQTSNHYYSWAGSLDDVRIYNRALSQIEITQLYNWAQGPVAYWKMDTGSGTTAIDSSGNGNNSSAFSGNVTWTQGKYGSGLSFDGNDAVAQVVETSSTDLGTTSDSYTLEAWFKSTTSTQADIITKHDGTGAFPFELLLVSGTVCFQISDGSNTPFSCSSTNFNDNVWHHAAGIRDVTNDKLFLYVDGTLVDSDTDTTTGSIVNNDNLSIGNGSTSYTNQDFTGSLDEVKMYNYARTPAQIIEDMNGGHPAVGTPVGSTVGHWRFDEGYGGTIYDKSPQAHNGLLGNIGSGSSAPTWKNDGKFGKALYFDGTNDYVGMGDVNNVSTNDFSISAWILPTILGNRAIVAKDTSGVNTYQFRLGLSLGKPYFIIGNSDSSDILYTTDYTLMSPTAISQDVWTHLAVTRSGTNYVLYVNGKEVDTASSSTVIDHTNTSPLTIGAQHKNGNPFRGIIDEVKFYMFTLTPEQIKIDMNQGKQMVFGAKSTASNGTTPDNSSARELCVPGDTSTCNTPIAEWNFEKVEGTNIYDTTGNGNTGTITNAINWTKGKSGRALNFNGSNYVTVADTDALDTTNNFTLSLWVKPSTVSLPLQGLISKGITTGIATPRNYAMYLINDEVSISWHNSNWYSFDTTSANLEANKLYYLVYTRGNNIETIYVNGMVKAQQPVSVAMLANTYAITIGTSYTENSSEFAQSTIDNVRIYNYVRTPAQINWEYNQGAPIGWYKLNENTGVTAKDWATSADGYMGNHGTLGIGTGSSAPVWTTGKYGTGLYFDGTEDYVSIPHQTYLNSGSGISVALWIKTSAAAGALISKHNENVTNGLNVTISSGKFQFDPVATGTHQNLLSNKTINDGNWHHVVGTLNGTDQRVYVDGLLDNTRTYTGTIATNSLVVYLGRQLSSSNPTSYFNGIMDDIKIFNYPLSAVQVKEIMNDGTLNFQ